MNDKIKIILMTLVFVVGIVVYTCVYTVDETEQVVITQFGRVVGEPIVKPGIKFKIPVIQKIKRFPDVLLEWDGDPGQVNTKDKKYIWVDTFARWKIVDPVKFLKTVADEGSAQSRLSEIINSEMRNLVTSHSLVESVRNTDRAMDTFQIQKGVDNQSSRYDIILGRDKITKKIKNAAIPKLTKFGIELEDVKIKRINYIDKVREAVYGRMIAERSQIAEKFRAEGMGKASEIRGQKERELQVVESKAYKEAQTIKGKADAKATLIYAKAYGVDPEFYSFLKTLDVYKTALGQDSTLVLSTDSDFMKYFKDIN
jgi:membrane protease subunit HflC